MSQHAIQKLAGALLLCLSLAPGAVSAQASGPSPDLGDSVRPRIMRIAAENLHSPPKAPTGRTATAQGTSPATATTTSSPALRRQVFGYVNAGNLLDPNVGYTTWQWQDLTEVAYFGISVNSDGTLVSGDLSTWNSDASTFVTAAHQHGVKAVVSLLQHDQSTLCASLAAAQTTVNQVNANLDGADGVNIDYEGTQASCSSSSGDTMSSRLDNLARLFRQGLPPAQSNLTIATYAAAAEFPGGFFDIPGLAPYVDFFFVMAYDLDNSNFSGTPLNCTRYCLNPVGPAYGQPDDPKGYWYNDTRAAETYTRALGSGAKVILGVPYYGWTACAQGTVGNQAAGRPGPNAYGDSSSPQWANPTYLDSSSDVSQSEPYVTQLQISTDPVDPANNQEPYATWWSPPAPSGSTQAVYYHNCWREMYWDDASSLGAKYDVVNSFNLAGAGIFTLDYGGGAPELWYDLSSHFACPSASDVAANPDGVTWQAMPGSARGVGASAGCTASVIGNNAVPGGYGVWAWTGTGWAAYPNGGGVRIATGPDRSPWVLNSYNQIYHWASGGWQRIPGSALDIAVGADGSVWAIGTNPVPGGYGIWEFDGTGWHSVPGGGLRIAAASAQNAWVVNAAQGIWQYSNGGWTGEPGSAYDIGAGGGAVWVVGTDSQPGGGGIYRWVGSGWVRVQGGAASIAVDPTGLPWVVNSSGGIYERL